MKTPTVLECKEYQEWPQCDYWIHVFKLEQLVRDKYLLYMTGLMIVSFAFLATHLLVRLDQDL